MKFPTTTQYGAFRVMADVDADGHMTLTVDSTDGSGLIELDYDCDGVAEFGVRFTTQKIEREYKQSQVAP